MSFELLPQHVCDLNSMCIQAVEQTLGFTLDNSPETLPLLDHYLRSHAETHAFEQHELLAVTAGSYFAQTLSLAFQGVHLDVPQENYEHWRVRLCDNLFCFNPVGLAHEVIRQDSMPGSHAHFEVHESYKELAQACFEQWGMIRHEDFYTLSVRFECAEQLIVTLQKKGSKAAN